MLILIIENEEYMAHLSKQQRINLATLMQQGRKTEVLKLLTDQYGFSSEEADMEAESLSKSVDTLITDRDNSTFGIRMAGWILSIAGIILLIAASYFFLDTHGKKTDWTTVEGRVAHLIVDVGEGGAAPVVVYTWRDDSLSYTSDVYSSPPAYKTGDPVKLYVDPASPEDAFIDSFRELYLFPTIIGVLGFVFVLIGLLILFFAKSV